MHRISRSFVQGAFKVVGVIGVVMAASACSTTDPAAEKAFNNDTAACERLENTDLRQVCFGNAMQKYQAAVAKANASSCPKASC